MGLRSAPCIGERVKRRPALPRWHTFGTGRRAVVSFRDAGGAEHLIALEEAREIRFESCLPSRVIPHRQGQRHTPGDYWSATTGRLVGYESWLESKWMTLLDFDPDVVAFSAQPMTLYGIDTDGSWEHTPDMFVRRADDSVLVLDVKNPTKTADPDVIVQAERTRWVCERLGWDYGLFAEPDPQLWKNVSWLAGFRRPPLAGIEYLPQILSLAERPAPFADICTFIDVTELARPVLLHLCWCQDIVFDLTVPLCDSTIVRVRDDRPAYHVVASVTPPSPDTHRARSVLTYKKVPMSKPHRLATGQWIQFCDQQYQVVGFTDTCTRIRARTGRNSELVMTSVLLAECILTPESGQEPATPVHGGIATDAAGTGCGEDEDQIVFGGWDDGALWDDIAHADRAAAQEMEAHLLEATTGFRSGTCDLAQPDEPRPQYLPSLPVHQRMQTKATELGYTRRRLWQLLAAYREHGVTELIDGRKLKGRNPLSRLDPRIVAAVLDQAAMEESESTGTMTRFRRRVQNRVDATHGPGAVTLPSQSTFRRALEPLLSGRYTFSSAKTRQTNTTRPGTPLAHVTAYRPGEIVMIDTSRLDVIAYDPVLDETYSCEITVAIDLYTRSLLAWRITPLGTKGIDIGLLVSDAMTPEPMRPGWKDALRFAYLRMPLKRQLSIDERFAAAAARPVIYPETILVDQGKPYKSEVMRRACNSLGISYPLARKGKPTDKPEVEAVFNTIRSQFSQHVAGYKGSDVASRGRDPQAQSRWTITELEEFFAEYVVAVYQRRWHKGLTVPGHPGHVLSPNEAYAFGIQQAGFVTCPTDPTMYFRLLPVEWRQITSHGVQLGNLHYDDANGALAELAMVKPPYPNLSGRASSDAWPIRYDPRNLLHAYIHNPLRDEWVQLRWTHALDEHQPFTDNTLREMIKFIGPRHDRRALEIEVAAALADLQNRTDAPETWTATDRRRAVRDAERARAAARDRQRAVATTTVPTHDRSAPLHAVPALPEGSLADNTIDLDDIDLSQVSAAKVWRHKPQER